MKLYLNRIEVTADAITPETTEPVVILREPGDTDADYERLGLQIEAQMYTDVERLTANLGTPSTRAFLDALFPVADGCAEFRTVPPRMA